MSTLTDSKDLKSLYDYFERNSIEFSVDNNPSPEKVSRIKQAIERKNELIDASIKAFKNTIRSKA